MKRLLLLFLLVTSLAEAESPTQLKTLSKKIAHIQATLSQDQSQRSAYLKELKATEINSGKTQLKLKKIKKNLESQQKRLNKLQENEHLYRAQLAKQQEKVAEQAQIIYALGQQPYLKLLLNQSDVGQISRTLTYYHYITQNQVIAIRKLESALDQLERNQQAILTETQKSKALKIKQETEHQKLTEAVKNRQQVIKKINAKINTKNKKLSALLDDKTLLEKAITQLKKPKKPTHTSSFTELKGKLPWPTQGKVLNYFGKPIQHSELSWSGLLIRGTTDQPVHAVASGKVVFAKWMPGYGLLLIIDHGNGYMTLYGRNHNLYKKPGDTVVQGELIAAVGQSGGYSRPALYFAIRHNAKALNPAQWCK